MKQYSYMEQQNEERQVARLSEIMALKHNLCPTFAKHIRAAALLHDMGKFKIPGKVLNKPGKLNKREFDVMKTHTFLGAALLSSIQGEIGVMAQAIALYHHEWHNGQGYWRKNPFEIPGYVPFVAISDVFIALVSERPYKSAWPVEKAIEYICEQAGTQFSPALVRMFIPLARKHNETVKEDNVDIPKETRRESYGAVLPTVKQRQSLILAILKERGPMTAQEVACELHKRGYTPSNERNFAAPRITELKKAGAVEATGKKMCSTSGRSVTVWAACEGKKT